MYQWEKYKAYPHDHWWANFVRAARLRTEQLQAELGPDAKITWLVYRQGYEDRAKQEHQDLISLIGTVRDRKSTRLNSSHRTISYAVFCLKKKKKKKNNKKINKINKHN